MKAILLFFVLFFSGVPVQAQKTSIVVNTGHSKNIECVVFDKTGKFFFTAGIDGFIIMWSTATKKQVRSFDCNPCKIHSIDITPDGKTLFAVGGCKRVFSFDIESGRINFQTDRFDDDIVTVVVSPDGKLVAFSTNSKIMIYKITPFESAMPVITGNQFITSLAFSPDSKTLAVSMKECVKIYDISASGTEKKSFTSDGIIFKSVTFSHSGKMLASLGNDNYLYIQELPSGKMLQKIAASNDGGDKSNVFSKNNKYIYFIGPDYSEGNKTLSQINCCDVSTGAVIMQYRGLRGLCSSISLSPDQKTLVASTYSNDILTWDTQTGYITGSFRGIKSVSAKVKFDKTFSLAAVYDEENSKIRIRNYITGNVMHTLDQDYGQIERVCFSNSGTMLAALCSKGALKIWNTKTGKEIYSTVFDKKYSSYQLNFTDDDKYVFSDAPKSGACLWDYAGSNSITVPDANYCSDGKAYLHYKTYEHQLILKEVSSNRILQTFTDFKFMIPEIAFSRDGKYVATSHHGNEGVILWNRANGMKVKSFSGHSNNVNCVRFSDDSKYLVSGSADKTIKIWEVETGALIKSFTGHNDQIWEVAFLNRAKDIFSVSDDGTCRVWNYNTGDYTAFVYNKNLNEWIEFTNDGYWDGSNNAGNFVSMAFAENTWNIDQFAPKNNRPDIIIRRLSTAFNDQADYFYQLFLKRLKRLGLSENTMVQENIVPEVVLNEMGQTGKFASVSFSMSDLRSNLKSYQIYVNDIPVFGSSGKSISGKTAIAKEIIELCKGDNKIEIMCKNEHGYESYRLPVLIKNQFDLFVISEIIAGSLAEKENFSVNDILYSINSKGFTDLYDVRERLKNRGIYSIEIRKGNEYITKKISKTDDVVGFAYEPYKPDLYYLAFGVSKYQDEKLNLKYADKDATDLGQVFDKMKGKSFNNIYIKTYTNEQVTVDNIKQAKDFLKNSKVDDTFVLFIAGHGMHDKDKEATYYFLTYNAQVDNLSVSAANFELIEDLLQGIPPRNKLFLMDTCESGELEEGTENNYFAQADTRGLKARAARGMMVKDKTAKETKKSRAYLFEKDRYIYNDLLRRSGAIVFSSSKGGEFSYERDELQNGLFTEEIMNALTTNKADKNNDGMISTDELRDYVSKAVSDLSGDLQHPTVDRDNIYQKFGFGIQ